MTDGWPQAAAVGLALIYVSEMFFAAGATSPLVRSERQQTHQSVAVEVRAQGIIVDAPRLVGEDGDWDRDDDVSSEQDTDNNGFATVPGSISNVVLPATQGDNDEDAAIATDASTMPSFPKASLDAERQDTNVSMSRAGVVAANDSLSVVELGRSIAPHETLEEQPMAREIMEAQALNGSAHANSTMVGQTASQDISPVAPIERGGSADRVLPGALPEVPVHGASGVIVQREPVAVGLAVEELKGTDRSGPHVSRRHHPQESAPSEAEADVEEIASGLGISAYEPWATGSRGFSRELRHRMQLQDFATVCVLVLLFAIVLFLSCSGVYQVAEDPSPVLFYSEGRGAVPRAVCSGDDADAFLQAFNGQPQSVRLRIIGRRPGRSDLGPLLNGLERRSRGCCPMARPRMRSPVLFDISLELATFVDPAGGRLSDGDVEALKRFLGSKNVLETFTLRKKVVWDSWQDIATNVRSRLRSLGFWGDVDVRLEATEEVTICRNHPWANFVKSRATQALAVVSVVGVFVWLPYAWARQKKAKAESHFRIDMDPERYWELVADGLHGIQGFQALPETHAVQQ